MIQLQDTDPMPFGKHRGVPMQDVPAHYMHWLWCGEGGPQLEHNRQSDVGDYIRRNLSPLKLEYADGIW